MYKMLLGTLIMLSQLSIEAYGCNTKILDSEADAWVSKTWSNVTFDEKQIRESLILLNPSQNSSPTQQQYLDSSEFDKLCDKIHDPHQRLKQFIDLCKNIYNEENIMNKVSVFMLLQNVAEKYDFIFRKAESLKPKEEEKNKEASPSSLDVFFNADKNIQVQ